MHRDTSSPGGPGRGHAAVKPDRVLLALLALLAVSLGAFALGWIDYPAGAVVLALFIGARLLALGRRRND